MPHDSDRGGGGAAPQPARESVRPASASYDLATVVRHIAAELRQPLGSIESIAAYLDLILPRTESKARRQLANVQQEVRRARWVLADAVHFLRAAPPHFQPLDLAEVVSKTLSQWRTPDGPNVKVEFDAAARLVEIDLEQVQHLLRNILQFCGRFLPPEEAMVLRTRAAGREVRLEIEASAPECTPADVEPLFEPFDSRLPAGSGLALASVRRIADVHRARVEAAVDPDGRLSLAVVFPTA
jgi:signal transduction histidine kinase